MCHPETILRSAPFKASPALEKEPSRSLNWEDEWCRTGGKKKTTTKHKNTKKKEYLLKTTARGNKKGESTLACEVTLGGVASTRRESRRGRVLA